MHMHTSDWVLVGTTVFLGAIAIFSTYLAEIVKRKLFAPKLAVKYEIDLPYCHKTVWKILSQPEVIEPVFFFHFQLENEGKSQARLCETIIEELWLYDAFNRPQKYQGFLPVNLGAEALNINPHRKLLVQLGHISSLRYQTVYERKSLIDLPGNYTDELRFMLNLNFIPFGQPNCFVPGKYAIKVSVYSENAPTKKCYFKIAWSGRWQLTEVDMLRELSIQVVESL